VTFAIIISPSAKKVYPVFTLPTTSVLGQMEPFVKHSIGMNDIESESFKFFE